MHCDIKVIRNNDPWDHRILWVVHHCLISFSLSIPTEQGLLVGFYVIANDAFPRTTR